MFCYTFTFDNHNNMTQQDDLSDEDYLDYIDYPSSPTSENTDDETNEPLEDKVVHRATDNLHRAIVQPRTCTGDVCPICLEVIKHPAVFCAAVCGKQFHLQCISTYERNTPTKNITCPLCRRQTFFKCMSSTH